MGNRAVIAYDTKPSSTAIYLHWNGGLESVLAFLEVCKRRGYRDPTKDTQYGMARLVGVIHEFISGDCSLGIGPLKECDVDNYDNGAYLIGPDWTIAERWGKGGKPTALDTGSLDKQDLAKFDAIVTRLEKKETV